MQDHPNLGALALRYHQRLPDSVRAKLNEAGLPNHIICRYRIGWDGNRITIPISDRERQVTFFRVAHEAVEAPGQYEVSSSVGGYPELYGWERLSHGRDWVVVCDGEFDRLILEAHDIPSITSTAGPSVLLDRWVRALYSPKIVYVCLRNDERSRDNALRIAQVLPHSRIVTLPKDVGNGGTIYDCFRKLGMKREDFMSLLRSARSPGVWQPLIPPLP